MSSLVKNQKQTSMFGGSNSGCDSGRSIVSVGWNKIDREFKKKKVELENPIIYTIDLTKCKSCGKENSMVDDGSYVCMTCGLIGETLLDMSPENVTADSNDKNHDNARHGGSINPLLQDSSFGSQIICGPNASSMMRHLSRMSRWSMIPAHEKTLCQEFSYITTMAQNGDIPTNVIDQALIIHKYNSEQKLFRGMNRDAVKAASIYLACLVNSCPRTPFEISQLFALDYKNTMFGCSEVMNMVYKLKTVESNELGNGMDNIDFSKITDVKPENFIPRFCAKLNISAPIIRLALFIAKKKLHLCNGIFSSKPHSIATGIIFYLSYYLELGITKKDLAQLCGISDVTVNNCFKHLNSIHSILNPLLQKIKNNL